jgi:hypothetical protein
MLARSSEGVDHLCLLVVGVEVSLVDIFICSARDAVNVTVDGDDAEPLP